MLVILKLGLHLEVT